MPLCPRVMPHADDPALLSRLFVPHRPLPPPAATCMLNMFNMTMYVLPKLTCLQPVWASTVHGAVQGETGALPLGLPCIQGSESFHVCRYCSQVGLH